MIATLPAFKSVVFLLALTSALSTGTRTCSRLENLYQSNVDTFGVALQAYWLCAAAPTAATPVCLQESHDLDLAREGLQAAFARYLTTCASRLASADEAVARAASP